MTAQEYIDACNECRTPQRAAELLRVSIELAEDDIKVRNIAERMKSTIERERAESKAAIQQYSEQVASLNEQVEELTAELEEKRIELAELGSLNALIGRLGAVTVQNEAAAEKLSAAVEQVDKLSAEKPQPDKPAPKPKKQLSKKADSKKVDNKDDPPGFTEFWEVYPKKVKRKLAAEKWAKISPDEELKKRIIAAVKAWSRTDEWTKDNGAYVPHPTVWLNGQRWNDELPKSAVTESGGGVHSYDLDKLLDHAKKNIPKFDGSDKSESEKGSSRKL
ncbi:MAG: hypothetical protein ACI4JK_05275 [Oscillospiraceae bacterium]